jgi:hypothetical protein
MEAHAIYSPIAKGRVRYLVVNNEASPARLQDQTVDVIEQEITLLQTVDVDQANDVAQRV